MKINMPVTDREIVMKKGTILVTKTDLKGSITYANDAFVEISGFSRNELIGSNHNVVRHPDMPPAAFKDLWDTVKAGNPWTALVKNRTKSGDYYWVEANVTPYYENKQVAGYLSVRQPPTRDQINQAEALYQKVSANQAALRPAGLSAKINAVRQMALWKKAGLALLLLLLPVFYGAYQAVVAGNYILLASVSASALLGLLLAVHTYRSMSRSIEQTIGFCHNAAAGYFRNQVDINRLDQIGDLNRALQSMQVKLNSDFSASLEAGASTERIKQALDQVTGNVMMADAEYNIIYMNNAAKRMFKQNETAFRRDLPDYNADALIGANIDVFHKNPAHQRGMLAKLTQTYRAELIIGGRTMVVIATPVHANETRLGTVVEWIDRSEEVSIQKEIAEIVEQVKSGVLNGRIAMEHKEGFFATLSLGINELTDVIETAFGDVARVMKAMSAGDLTQSITTDYQGVYAQCKNDINETVDKLSEIVSHIRSSADFISNTSHEIASGNNNLSQRVETQASSLEETASSMEQLTGTVKNNADNAQQANQVANMARQLAEKGGTVVNSAVTAMAEINESSNKIAEIIGVIDEIAFQTNLLALNASVEAARAGEHGRGFSVVATEVRNLAQRSAVAAKESKELIQNSVQKVRSGTEFVNETGAALQEIVISVKKVGDIISEIASASTEQAQGIQQVNQAVSQMDEITQQNAALAEEASAASVSMSDQATTMADLLTFFKLDQVSEKRPEKVSHAPVKARVNLAPVKAVPASGFSATADKDEWEEF
ncbi:methyl-accepting chemotaxis protein [Methylicorpusculum sp.]|uniref:methyl-accepting chemotaxis protein n=1 Tax=Methylicorpusculum sp. TaxID=2713644 RepID=UPI00273177B9|nr:methyl-accepting chemotaxis protein [Methylicorpusculum sp.]MDP2177974.1 methyl-accepting chemotaxis protein [Methylicorpusculum sp.]MDP3528123.1 methyl-accepting chemotaxis protein [Methylicorpusculum sp.]MDZ4150165.1 methyl-accepting chemotaxis protein [Methylicorpusculum sp.]